MLRQVVFNIAAFLVVSCFKVQAQEVLSVHGSGTTNPSKCYWLIMEQIMERTKLPTRFTYRAVGSGTGQEEFMNDLVDFGSGDIPFSTADYNAMNGDVFHLPVVMGAISVFHSVPNIPTTPGAGLNLTSCLLSRIFLRDITTWDHPDILADNRALADLLPYRPFPIRVAHRVSGSSSTASLTEYLHVGCPNIWPLEKVDKEIIWPDDTVGCEGSGGMTDCILEVEGTIGYIDAGHGHEEGLNEIELKNADGRFLTSKDAAGNGGIAAAGEGAVPPYAGEDFGSVNLLNRGGEYTWPIVAMSYVYVRQNLAALTEPQQALLLAFLEALYRDEYISQCESQFRFTRVSDGVAAIAKNATDSLKASIPPELVFTFETSITDEVNGSKNNTISVKRRTFAEYERSSLVDDIAELKIKLALAEAELRELSGNQFENKDETQLTAALTMASLSFILWMFTLLYLFAKKKWGI